MLERALELPAVAIGGVLEQALGLSAVATAGVLERVLELPAAVTAGVLKRALEELPAAVTAGVLERAMELLVGVPARQTKGGMDGRTVPDFLGNAHFFVPGTHPQLMHTVPVRLMCAVRQRCPGARHS